MTNKTKILITGLVLCFCLISLNNASGETEPNNNYNSANTIGFDSPVTGTISQSGDIDWFTLTTTVTGDLKVIQTEWPGFIETRIAVYGPNNPSLQQSNPANIAAAAPGTYYIKLWSANNGFSDKQYKFSATLTQASTGNDVDGGKNSASGAVLIKVGDIVSDTIAPSKETSGKPDVDWFTLTTTITGDLKVIQTEWPGFIETRIAVYGPNNPSLQQSNPANIAAAAPGTYYIKVWSANDGSSITPYKFSATLTQASTGNDVDGGKNSASGAVLIKVGDIVSDTIAPSKETSGKPDVDWFTFTTTVTGDLKVIQTEWPGFIETRIAVYGPNNPSLQQSNPANIAAAAPGTYYIKVWSANDGSSITPYKFSVSLGGTKPSTSTETTPPSPTTCSFTGVWTTKWGDMTLTQTGSSVTGTYTYNNNNGKITGTLSGNTLTGKWSEVPTYSEPNDGGDIEFKISGDCKSFSGKWRYGSSGGWSSDWSGTLKNVPPQQNPPGITSSTLSWKGMDKDKVGKGGAPGPDGDLDGYFSLTLNPTGAKTINKITLWSTDKSGTPAGGQIWDTEPNGYWILGVEQPSGNRLNPTDNSIKNLKTITTTTTFELYAGNSGYFKEGQYFKAVVEFTDGTSTEAITSVSDTVNKPDPTTQQCTGTSTYAYIESITMEKGKEARIAVMMCNAKDLANMDFGISYNPGVLKFKDAEKGSLNSNSLFESNEISSGNIKISFASSAGVSGSGSIAILVFDVAGSSGDSTILSSNTNTASTSSGSPVGITINPGVFTVGSSVPGDCDGDGFVTSRDALAALQMSVGKIKADLCYDVTKDGRVDSSDAREILKKAVKRG